ncbi:MAG: hypothetical protein WD069_22430 [Planctomycetales bacterium]
MAYSNVHSMTLPSGDDENRKEAAEAMDQMRNMFGPGHVDQAVRSAIQACWMALPKERRNADEVEKEVRRIVDRALTNYREDAAAFGRGD